MSTPDTRLVALARSVAASLAEDVEREAMERATARVRERLVADYAAALEEALLDELQRRRPTAPEQAAIAADEPLGWYLYAIVDRPDADLVGEPGLDPDHVIETVGPDGVVAVGSPIRLSLLSGRDDADLAPDGWFAGALRRHEQIVERAGATVAPMRFGTVYPDRADVARLLEANRDALAEELARLAGTAEWGVKLVGVRAARPAAARSSTDTGDASGAGYLRAKAESRAQTLQAQEAERSLLSSAHERLAVAAADATVTPVQRGVGTAPVPLLNASYLVHESRLSDFERAVAELAEDCRAADVEVQVTGPWPAYHFTRLQLADPGPSG